MPALPTLGHLATLTDDVGIIQHAMESVPNRRTGYCTDDVARAFIVALQALQLVPRDEAAARFASTYLAFLEDAQLDDGRFHNFMSYERSWLDEVGTQDSCGRAMWALGYGVRHAPREPWRRVCRALLDRSLRAIETFEYLRPRAYAISGLVHAFPALHETAYASALRHLADGLAQAYERTRDEQWAWFEPAMTYDNARLPEALLRAGQTLGERHLTDLGLVTLAFYERTTLENGVFVPIGNEGWFPRGGERAVYQQQPLEAYAMIDAELAAYDATSDAGHVANAETALAWYYGKNTRGIIMAHDGGCYDGLGQDGANRNMGAESTLALLASSYTTALRQSRTLRAVR
ncbi:MAG: glycosyltransferase [Candidatus Eremiobacteraeota bacterium]|nr:glycosyltransferase [Candidatus Eremiobacteraeota bacterium]